MELSNESKQALFRHGIPSYMHEGIIGYYENGWKPGSFLSAIINNDLKEAFTHADDTNKHCIKNYIMWFYAYAPSGTWGYPNAVDIWINSKEFQPVGNAGQTDDEVM